MMKTQLFSLDKPENVKHRKKHSENLFCFVWEIEASAWFLDWPQVYGPPPASVSWVL